MYRTILFTILLSTCYVANASTITSVIPGGEWTSASTWTGGVVPSNGDIVVIPVGSTVTISNQTVDFNGTVNVSGTLSLIGSGSYYFGTATPGILNMDASSIVNVLSGGQITTGGSGGGSLGNRIEVGSNTFAYNVSDGTVTGPASVDESNGVMPVELLFFDAKLEDEQVVLNWATASEDNFDYFSIERSRNGQEFVELAQLSGKGNSTTRTDYSFIDELPLIGRSYYRLKSIDFDGYTEIFDYVMVVYEGADEDFTIYPNPVIDNRFTLQTNFEVEEEQALVVYNAMGKVEKTYRVNSWMNEFITNDLMPGSYLIKLTTSKNILVKRLLIK